MFCMEDEYHVRVARSGGTAHLQPVDKRGPRAAIGVEHKPLQEPGADWHGCAERAPDGLPAVWVGLLFPPV